MVDTDVASFLFKRHELAASYAEMLEGRVLMMSFMGVAELHQWAARNDWGTTRIERLESNIERYVLVMSEPGMCKLWSQVRQQRFSSGRPISPQDSWHAASALWHGVPLVSNNAKDFEGIDGLELWSLRS